MPAHIDYRIDVVDEDWAFVDAGPAGCARPQFLGVDNVWKDEGSAVSMSLIKHNIPKFQNDLHRGE
jgi:hypothetical protein